jgi:NADPH:quinone reductase-like Zn-dependent oxidoreductase
LTFNHDRSFRVARRLDKTLSGGDALRGYVLERYGDASAMSLRVIPEPEPGPGEVLVQVRAAGLDPVDYKVREAGRRRVRYRYLFMRPSGADLEFLGELVRQAGLRVVVDQVYPLGEIAEAFAYLQQGHAKGKVIVEMT